MKVFLVGEGPNELGSWGRHPSYRSAPTPGALEALLRRVCADGWEIGGATLWKDIRKYRSGTPESAETRNVLGAALDAVERGCDVLVLVRDRDGDPDRAAALTRGIALARRQFPMLTLVAGAAVEKLESWVLALHGMWRSERLRHPERALGEAGVAVKDTAAYVAIIQVADLDQIPEDAHTLRDWVAQARAALG